VKKKTKKSKTAPKAKKVTKTKGSKKKEPTVKELARGAAMAGATVTISYEKGETMDRTALKAIAAQLKEMGSEIKVLKSDSDEQLQKKVNEQLKALPKPDILKKLDDIVPEKLVQVLKSDCIGIFIDLSDVSCVKCKDAGKCASLFLQNVKGGFEHVSKAFPDKVEEKKPVAEKAKLVPVSRYEPDRLVFVRDVKNPNPPGDSLHDTLQAILDEEPSTLEELREIIERDFDLDSDGDFMKFVTSMRDPNEGVIKLDVDLSEKNKAELRKAGVEI
jgi:hypothetical protein